MNDLISRQATIDDVCDYWCERKNSQCPHPFKPEEDDREWCEGCGIVERIKNLPSAQPETAKRIAVRSKGGVVMDGYDPQRYITGIVFRGKEERDEFGWELDRMGITFDARDDGYIDDKFAEEWK